MEDRKYTDNATQPLRNETPQDRSSRRTAVATVWIAILALVSAAIGFGQFWILRGTLNELRDEQRPWVGAAGVWAGYDDKSPGSYLVTLGIANTGKSPALNVTVTIAEWATDPATLRFPITQCQGSKCRAKNIEMLPGAQSQLRIPEIGKTQPKFGEVSHVIARIDYNSPNGEQHRTDVCYAVSVTQEPEIVPNRHSLAVDTPTCEEQNSSFAD